MKWRSVKEFYNEFLYLPKHGVPHEHAVLMRLVASIAVILACVSIIGYSAVAYFSDSVSTTLAHISAANFDVEVSDCHGNSVDGVYVVEFDGSGLGLEFKITAQGSASCGYCVVYVDGERFETEKIEQGETLQVEIFAKTDSEIVFEPHWGTPSEPVETISTVDLVEYFGVDGDIFAYHTVCEGESVDSIAYDFNVAADVVRYLHSVMWECGFEPEIEFLPGEELMIPIEPQPFEELIRAEYERLEEEALEEEESEIEDVEEENEEIFEEIEQDSEVDEEISEEIDEVEEEIDEEKDDVVLSDETIEEFADELFDIIQDLFDSDEENEPEIEDPIDYEYDIVIECDLFDDKIYAAHEETFEFFADEGVHEIYFTAAPDMAEGYVYIVLGGEVGFYTLPITPDNEVFLELETPDNAEIFFEIFAEPMNFEPVNGYVGDDLTRDDEISDKYIDYELYVETEVLEDGFDENSENDEDLEVEESDSENEETENDENTELEDGELDGNDDENSESDTENGSDPVVDEENDEDSELSDDENEPVDEDESNVSDNEISEDEISDEDVDSEEPVDNDETLADDDLENSESEDDSLEVNEPDFEGEEPESGEDQGEDDEVCENETSDSENEDFESDTSVEFDENSTEDETESIEDPEIEDENVDSEQVNDEDLPKDNVE